MSSKMEINKFAYRELTGSDAIQQGLENLVFWFSAGRRDISDFAFDLKFRRILKEIFREKPEIETKKGEVKDNIKFGSEFSELLFYSVLKKDGFNVCWSNISTKPIDHPALGVDLLVVENDHAFFVECKSLHVHTKDNVISNYSSAFKQIAGRIENKVDELTTMNAKCLPVEKVNDFVYYGIPCVATTREFSFDELKTLNTKHALQYYYLKTDIKSSFVEWSKKIKDKHGIQE